MISQETLKTFFIQKDQRSVKIDAAVERTKNILLENLTEKAPTQRRAQRLSFEVEETTRTSRSPSRVRMSCNDEAETVEEFVQRRSSRNSIRSSFSAHSESPKLNIVVSSLGDKKLSMKHVRSAGEVFF